MQETKKTTETPQIGEIWLATYPEIYYEEDMILNVRIQTRPFLVLDDGRGLLVEEDNSNYHAFKLTTKYKNDKRRKLINNWKEKGLKKKSYVRIEMPLKLEYQQFQKKICSLTDEELIDMYRALYSLLNITALEKIAKSEKETVTV